MFGQYMGSVPTQRREVLICSYNPGIESQKWLWTRHADHKSLLNWLDDLLTLSADKWM